MRKAGEKEKTRYNEDMRTVVALVLVMVTIGAVVYVLYQGVEVYVLQNEGVSCGGWGNPDCPLGLECKPEKGGTIDPEVGGVCRFVLESWR